MAAINVRGTSGSGKSTIVRAVMSRFQERLPAFIEGRRQPISYLMKREGVPDLRVMGHYEIPCGGCDTISSYDVVYGHIQAAIQAGENVLFEGIMIGDEVTRCVGLKKLTDLHVIALNTPIEICLAGVRARREAKGNREPLNETNTRNRAARLPRTMARLKDAGVNARWMSRDDALAEVAGILGVGQLADIEEQLREEGA